MKREFLKGLGIDGLTDDVIKQIMDEHGVTVEANKKAAEAALSAVRAERDARADIKPDDLEALRGQLKTAAEAAKAYEGVDVNALNTSLAEAQSALEELRSKHAEQMAATATELLLREKLAPIAFSSDYARNGVLADVKAKIKYEPGENGALGAIAGFDEAIAEIREGKPTAFSANDPPPKKDEGREHKSGDGTPSPKKEVPILI